MKAIDDNEGHESPQKASQASADEPTSGDDSSTDGKSDVTEFHPRSRDVPAQLLPNKEHIKILNQQTEGSAVGHGMAAMINYLLHERGIRDDVSVRMLQQLSKQYDGTALDVDQGSQLHSGMKAWYENGVCTEELWPYRPGEWGELTPERQRAARKYRPISYRSVPKDVPTMQAALFECHVAVAGAAAHDGWMSDRASKTGIISFSGKERIIGGHAFGIVGYTEQGFIIQNSWGAAWGGVEVEGTKYPGCALWSYGDFEKNYTEGFVATLPDNLEGRPRLRRAGYQSDTTEGRDMLDISSDVEAVCTVLAARDVKPPLALGLFGNWGTGKSFFMARMYEEIERLAKLESTYPGKTPYCSTIVQIRFNAWHYLDSNLWASLVNEIFKNLLIAVSSPSETNQAARRRIVKQLGEARGLFRQSEMELESAKQEQERADAVLKEKQVELRAQENTIRSIGDQLMRLLDGKPQVQQELKQLADAMGEPELAQSYQALKKQTDELEGFGGVVRQAWREVGRQEGRTNRILLLILFPAACVAISLLVKYLLKDSTGALSTLRHWTNATSGLMLGVAAWLATQLARIVPIVKGLRETAAKVDTIRDQRIADLTARERQELDSRRKDEEQAHERADRARQRVESLQAELRELDPSRQLQTFLRDRGSSEDYQKQLGLVSLVRRDFDQLSKLLEQTEKLEDKWYARKLKADEAKKELKLPKRSMLPMRRIVLYIDDLDRCQPERVVEVLEAVHLLLAFPLFVVVVAVDPRWLRECLQKQYPRLLAMDGISQAALVAPSTPQDYLEKIFQIPFYLRPISKRGYRNLIDGLMSSDLDLGTDTAPTARERKTEPSGEGNSVKSPGTKLGMSGLSGVVSPAARDGGTASSADPANELEKMNPERLKFRYWEVNDMKLLAQLFRTPRSVKRFVNTYRLIRVSIPEADMVEFIGSESEPGRYRIAQVLLSVVCGYPNIAPRFLQLLLAQAESKNPKKRTWSRFVSDCAGLNAGSKKANKPAPATGAEQTAQTAQTPGASKPLAKQNRIAAAAEESTGADMADVAIDQSGREWRELCAVLKKLDKSFVPENLDAHYDLVLRAARFSFSVSTLPE